MINDPIFTFPCIMTIKVMGPATLEFEAAVMEILRKHVPQLGEGAVVLQPSKKNTYVAMRVTVQADSREQMDAIYHDLSQHPLVKLAL